MVQFGSEKIPIENQSNQIEAEGTVSWFIKRGNMLFGYIESTCGKEVYFDTSSLMMPECADISTGDKVRFVIVKIDLGDGARKVRKIDAGTTYSAGKVL